MLRSLRLDALNVAKVQSADQSWTVVQLWNRLQPAIDSRRIQAARAIENADDATRTAIIDELVFGEAALAWAVLSRLSAFENDGTNLFATIRDQIRLKEYLKLELSDMSGRVPLASDVSSALFKVVSPFDTSKFNYFPVVTETAQRGRGSPLSSTASTQQIVPMQGTPQPSQQPPNAPPGRFSMVTQKPGESDKSGTRRSLDEGEAEAEDERLAPNLRSLQFNTSSIGTLVAQGTVDSF